MRRLWFILMFAARIAAVEVDHVTVVSVESVDSISVQIGDVSERIHLLYVDIPATPGQVSPEANRAKTFLAGLLPAGKQVELSAPGEQFVRDAEGRILALVHCSTFLIYGIDSMDDDGRLIQHKTIRGTAQHLLIAAGHSVYSRKDGDAAPLWHQEFIKAQSAAEFMEAGCWKTIPQVMLYQANRAGHGHGQP